MLPFSDSVAQAIIESKVHVASDALAKNNAMAGHWCMKDLQQQMLESSTMFHKEWKCNTIVGAEAIVLLQMLEVIERKGRHITSGKIRIGFDNREAHEKIVNKIVKASVFSQDSGAEIARIKETLDTVQFEIEILLQKGHDEVNVSCQRAPLKHLIRECDRKARECREKTHRREGTHNLRFLGSFALQKNGIVTNRSMKEAIRIIDTNDIECECAKSKFGTRVDFIDIEARNSFQTKKVSTSLIKYANSYNQCGARDEIINQKMVGAECLRCSEPETWEHVILCEQTKNHRKPFVENALKELMKNRPPQTYRDVIIEIIKDIVVYLRKGDEEEYATNQHLIGMHYLFRGYPVKDWKGLNFGETKYESVNKILVKHCVNFYEECWDHRNEIKHNPNMQRERAIRWHKKLKIDVERNQPMQVKLFTQRNRIDVERCRTENIMQWICNTKKMTQKIEKLPNTDMCRFFGPREN